MTGRGWGVTGKECLTCGLFRRSTGPDTSRFGSRVAQPVERLEDLGPITTGEVVLDDVEESAR